MDIIAEGVDAETKHFMVVFDPETGKPVEIEVDEDGNPVTQDQPK